MTNSNDTLKVFLSPSCYWVHFLGIPILEILVLLGVVISSWYYAFDLPSALQILACVHLLYIPAIPFSLLLKKCFVIAYLDPKMVQSKRNQKTLCSFSWQDINYLSFVKSYNYSNDVKPIYVVLSKEFCPRTKNAALSFDEKKQIVLRMTKRNYDSLMIYLKKLKFFDLEITNFEGLNQLISTQELHFSSNSFFG